MAADYNLTLEVGYNPQQLDSVCNKIENELSEIEANVKIVPETKALAGQTKKNIKNIVNDALDELRYMRRDLDALEEQKQSAKLVLDEAIEKYGEKSAEAEKANRDYQDVLADIDIKNKKSDHDEENGIEKAFDYLPEILVELSSVNDHCPSFNLRIRTGKIHSADNGCDDT